MAYARPFGQAQAASPWSSGVPPGLQQQQQQQAQQVQPMFNQPMGAFDISGAWQSQQPAAQQWVQPMQQVQFVPNPAYMQQPQMRQIHQQHQRPMHQRSLSAPRIGANGLRGPMNKGNSSFGGQPQHWSRSHQNNNNHNNNNQYQHRITRQQSRKGQFNHNNNNNNHNKQQHQQQQQNKQQQPATKQVLRKGTAKVTKVKKQAALKGKLGVKAATASDAKVEKAEPTTSDPNAADATDSTDVKAAATDDSSAQPAKTQSKTAERKQLKLQARKNAEALKQSKLPVAKASPKVDADADAKDLTQTEGVDQKVDTPIDQAQLKCVPAVFGFVCRLCDVFLRDKIARREHIDSDDHMERFKASEQASEEPVKQEPAE